MTTARPTISAPFVRSDAGRLRAAIVARPTAGLAHIAPLHGESSPIVARADEQFAILERRLTAAGVELTPVEIPDGAPGTSAIVDGALLLADGALMMRPSDIRRRVEVAALEAALVAMNVPIVGRIAAPGLLDGGDVIVAGETLFVGVSTPRRSEIGIPRSLHGNALGREQLKAFATSVGMRVVEVAMAAEATRLRAVAALVDHQTVVLAAGLLDRRAFDGFETIVAPRGEDFGAGSLALGNRRILANLRFRETIPLLRRAKFTVDAIDLWEFGKVGVTPSTMVLALKRD